jgi:decaprenyl-phosphate phosphoribosyltransferase
MTDLATPPAARPLPLALLVEARPKQWAKNVLVFIAPAAAGVLDQPDRLLDATIAFVAFCAAASGTYFLNDAADVDADRRHPTKHRRPVAAGEIPVGLARTIGAGLLLLSVAIGALGNLELVAVLIAYVVLTSLYSTWLKHIAVIDMAVVAAGFLLRAAGGAVATEVPISSWFYIVASAASMFIVAGKRLSELRAGGQRASETRSALAAYSERYLGYVLAVASGTAILAYCLWAFGEAAELTAGNGPVWLELSSVPFVLGLLRYALLIDAGGGGEPEELLLKDRVLQGLGCLWVVVFGIGIYVA